MEKPCLRFESQNLTIAIKFSFLSFKSHKVIPLSNSLHLGKFLPLRGVDAVLFHEQRVYELFPQLSDHVIDEN